MATTINIETIGKGIKTVRNRLDKWNEKVLDTTELAISKTPLIGERWQNVLKKGLRGTANLAKQQEELMWYAAETFVKQAIESRKKAKGQKVKTPETPVVKKAEELAEEAPAVETVVEKAEELVEEAPVVETVVEKVEELVEEAPVVETVVEKVEELVEEAPVVETVVEKAEELVEESPVVETVVEKAEELVEESPVVETVVEKAEELVEESPVVETVVEKVKELVEKAPVVTVNTVTDDLTTINGIGEKTAEILNVAGITTFEKLAEAEVDTLKNILTEASPYYKNLDPAIWIEAAKLK